jgi:purine catabolism regulator
MQQHAGPLESDQPAADREAADRTAASRSTPLTIVSGAVAGDDLERVAGAASEALGRPVAIALPALGMPVICPPGSIVDSQRREIVEYAAAVIRGEAAQPPESVGHAVPIRIGREVIGLVATSASSPDSAAPDELPDEQRAWLEATADAAAVATLMRDAEEGSIEQSRRALLQTLRNAAPGDAAALGADARRLGFDFSSGALAVCALARDGDGAADASDPVQNQPGLIARIAPGFVLGLVPLGGGAEDGVITLVDELSALAMEVAVSAPRRDPALLAEALREAELLAELARSLGGSISGQEETYRLLIGVLIRNPEELELLRAQTVSALSAYDVRHDTDLLATLETFLVHDGSTTETAEAMNLHRHTVGYRLSRAHEVSGLSPYESDGRERLSLGLKAHQILEADGRRSQR